MSGLCISHIGDPLVPPSPAFAQSGAEGDAALQMGELRQSLSEAYCDDPWHRQKMNNHEKVSPLFWGGRGVGR